MGVPSPKEGRKEGGERREGGREASRIPPGSAVGAAGAEAAAAPPSPSSSSSSPSSPLRTPGPPARRRGGRCGGGRSRAPRCPESSMVREGGMARPPYSSAQDIQMDVFDNAALQVTPRGGGEGVRESPGEGGSAPLYCITSPRLCPPPPPHRSTPNPGVGSQCGGHRETFGDGANCAALVCGECDPPPKINLYPLGVGWGDASSGVGASHVPLPCRLGRVRQQ